MIKLILASSTCLSVSIVSFFLRTLHFKAGFSNKEESSTFGKWLRYIVNKIWYLSLFCSLGGALLFIVYYTVEKNDCLSDDEYSEDLVFDEVLPYLTGLFYLQLMPVSLLGLSVLLMMLFASSLMCPVCVLDKIC